MSVESSKSDIHFPYVIAMLFGILCHIGPCHAWWCCDIETLSRLLVEKNPPVTRTFPSQKGSYVELCCFPLCLPEQPFEQIMNLPMISDAMIFMWCHCNDDVLRMATDFILDSHSLLITMHSLGIAISSSHCNFVTSYKKYVNHIVMIYEIHPLIHVPLPYSFKPQNTTRKIADGKVSWYLKKINFSFNFAHGALWCLRATCNRSWTRMSTLPYIVHLAVSALICLKTTGKF